MKEVIRLNYEATDDVDYNDRVEVTINKTHQELSLGEAAEQIQAFLTAVFGYDVYVTLETSD
jgi:hypothetical protein